MPLICGPERGWSIRGYFRGFRAIIACGLVTIVRLLRRHLLAAPIVLVVPERKTVAEGDQSWVAGIEIGSTISHAIPVVRATAMACGRPVS